jgi:hypothetical protein
MNEADAPTPAPYEVRHGDRIFRLADLTQPRRERLFAKEPRVALVIGTFAAIPYIHLQLEARRRLYPEVPMLVQDDCSPFGKELSALCREYGAEFASNTTRFPAAKGDMTAMVHGLVWAREMGSELLVKLSRRFVPRVRWTDDLVALAMTSQYATYCSWTTSFNFGFRSECVGFAVEEWMRLGLCEALVDRIMTPGRTFVEGFVHGLARRAAEQNCLAAIAFDKAIGLRPPERNSYAPWPFMGTDRRAPMPGYLWHDWARARDYVRLAQEWGLSYKESDFADPNMACGRQPPEAGGK